MCCHINNKSIIPPHARSNSIRGMPGFLQSERGYLQLWCNFHISAWPSLTAQSGGVQSSLLVVSLG